MALVHHNFLNIIKFDSYDVHPPFYYLLLKTFLNIFTFWTKSIFIKIIFARILSLSCLLLGVMYLFKILRIIDIHVDKYIQFVSVFLIPSVMMFSTQIRMYSLGFTLSVLSLYELMSFINKKSLKHLFFAFIFIVLASYTHYFAGLFVGILVLILCIYEFLVKQRSNGIKIFLLDILLVLMFMPWFFYTLPHLKYANQINSKSILKKIVVQFIKCIFSFCGILNSSLNSTLSIYIKVLLVLFIYILIIICYFWSLRNLSYKFNALLFINLSAFILVLIIGSIADIILGFEFSVRFVYPAFLINSFLIIVIISKICSRCKSSKYLFLFIPILIICLCDGFMNINSNVHNLHYSNHIVENCKSWDKRNSKYIYINDTDRTYTKSNPLYENSLMSHREFNYTDKATLLMYMNKEMYCTRGITAPISNGSKLGYKVWPNIYY